MSDIFVSYASEDRERIMPLVRVLEKTAWSVFWDRTIPAGKTWREVIGGEIQSARCEVVVWTETSVKSRWVQEEAEVGIRRGILIPVLLDRVEPPFGFGSIQAADLVGWDGDDSAAAVVRLLRDISAILGPSPAETGAEERRRSEEAARREAEEARAREQERRRAEEETSRRSAEEAERAKAEAAAQRPVEQSQAPPHLWQARYVLPAVAILIIFGAIILVLVKPWRKEDGPAARIAELLDRARRAENESRLMRPPDDNAANYYRQVLQLDPDHPGAREGLDRIAEKFLAVAERALAERRFDEAAGNLEMAASVKPDHPLIAELGRQLEKLRAQGPGAVVIRSKLAGVNVFIDDKLVGTTSREGELAAENLRPDRHHIVGRKSGFEPWEREIVVRPGEPSSVFMEMRPRILERVVEAAYPQHGGKIPFVDLDRGREVEFSDKEADFSFKDDGTGNFAATSIFISAHNGARICRTVPAPENPWQCEPKAYGKGIEVRQGQWVSCVTSRGHYCRMNIEMKGPRLTVSLWLYEARFEDP